ncbi:MAG: amidohydrolase family protein [Candidatus Rokuibacteriota bacterium]
MGHLIEDALVVTMDAGRRVLDPGHVLIEGRRLAAVGRGRYPGDRARHEVHDAAGHIVMPGLVNGHTHSYANLVKGTLENIPLEIWMLYAMPQGRHMEPEDVVINAALGAIDMLKGGVTCCLDQLAEDRENLALVAREYRRIGLRAVLAPMFGDVAYGQTLPEVMTLPGGDRPHSGRRAPPTADGILAMVEDLAAECHRPDEGIVIGVGPSGPQRCTDALLRGSADLADRLDLPIHTHLLETRAQEVTAYRLYGRSMVDHLDRLGFLRRRLSLAHAIWLTREEIDLVAARGASVVSNPVCNMGAGSGVPPLLHYRAAGVNVGLGTDGANGPGRQSMFEVMKAAGMAARIQDWDFARWPTAMDLLAMATSGSARALGLGDQVGSLEPGKQADLVLLRRDVPALTPLNDVAWQLVQGVPESAVERVIVGGRIVVDRGRVLTVDESAVLRAAAARGRRLLDACRDEVAAVRRLHPEMTAMLQRAYATPTKAVAACWHG